jgi:ABC-type amino acid transport substrate-binding protein
MHHRRGVSDHRECLGQIAGRIRRRIACPYLGLVACLILAASGCQRRAPADALTRIRETKLMRVGTDATYPPFESIDTATKEVAGFDADLIREVSARIGARVEFLVVPFDGILPALNAGKYDAVISAMTITDDRAKEVLFSSPYYTAGQSIVVKSGSPIRAAADLRGKKIGVQLGTTGEREAHRVDGAEVISFDAISAAFIDLANGRLDAVIADTPTTALFARDHPEIVMTGEPITRESYGIAFRKTDASLKQAVDGILADIERDGTLGKLRERWKLATP